jgi:GT2 family glycosyltransferase
MKDITFVITSCGRFDLLTKTVQSFLHLNSYPIKRYLLIEDSCDETMYAKIKNSVLFKEFDIVYNKEKLGQIKSIDYAYSQVDTDYIFHCEDDRLFTRTGFIEDSLQVIESDPKIFQVRIRSPKYTNRSVDPTLYTVNDVSYYIL